MHVFSEDGARTAEGQRQLCGEEWSRRLDRLPRALSTSFGAGPGAEGRALLRTLETRSSST